MRRAFRRIIPGAGKGIALGDAPNHAVRRDYVFPPPEFPRTAAQFHTAFLIPPASHIHLMLAGAIALAGKCIGIRHAVHSGRTVPLVRMIVNRIVKRNV